MTLLLFLQKGQEELQQDKGPVRDAELAMIAILADRCRFEAQTGHAELALGLYQAALEFSLFAPLVQLTESNKRRLFEAFWDSKARRVGEEGALGWAAWLEREEENFQVAQAQQARLAEEHPGNEMSFLWIFVGVLQEHLRLIASV